MSFLANLRERRSNGQLADELATARARAAALRDAAAGLLACIKALALDVEEIGAPKLKGALEATLTRLRADPDSRPLSDELAEELRLRQRETLVFAQEEHRYLDDRDAELRRIIEVLSDGLGGFGEDNASYDRGLLAQGARLEAASQLGDLVKMREVIVREVRDLRQAVAAKQAEDKARTAALTHEVGALRQDVEEARSAAATDALTGAANRAAFDTEIERVCDLAVAGGEGFALLLIDIDHFKAINDKYGHPVGDRVLMALVGFCQENVRRGDLVARWGGEEFAIVLGGASLRVGFTKARRIVKELAKRRWSVDAEEALAFTISAGATAWRAGDTPATLVERADRALYAAKNGGRNRAVKAV